MRHVFIILVAAAVSFASVAIYTPGEPVVSGFVAEARSEQAAVVVSDLKVLAGTWQGYAVIYPVGTKTGSRAITVDIKEDGSYTSYGNFMVKGNITLDGKLSYRSSLSSGIVTLYEEKGQQTLKFWLDEENGKLAGEYDRVK